MEVSKFEENDGKIKKVKKITSKKCFRSMKVEAHNRLQLVMCLYVRDTGGLEFDLFKMKFKSKQFIIHI